MQNPFQRTEEAILARNPAILQRCVEAAVDQGRLADPSLRMCYPTLVDGTKRLRGTTWSTYVTQALSCKPHGLFRKSFVVPETFTKQCQKYVETYLPNDSVAVLPPLFARTYQRAVVCFKARALQLVLVSKEDAPHLSMLSFTSGPVIPVIRTNLEEEEAATLKLTLRHMYSLQGVLNLEEFTAYVEA